MYILSNRRPRKAANWFCCRIWSSNLCKEFVNTRFFSKPFLTRPKIPTWWKRSFRHCLCKYRCGTIAWWLVSSYRRLRHMLLFSANRQSGWCEGKRVPREIQSRQCVQFSRRRERWPPGIEPAIFGRIAGFTNHHFSLLSSPTHRISQPTNLRSSSVHYLDPQSSISSRSSSSLPIA